MIRKIIHIDEEKCNGCGLCAEACHEGAIDIVDGKAKLVRENFCDGFGDCLPGCPAGAISFEEREAPAYDEEAVKAAQTEKTCQTKESGRTDRASQTEEPGPIQSPDQTDQTAQMGKINLKNTLEGEMIKNAVSNVKLGVQMGIQKGLQAIQTGTQQPGGGCPGSRIMQLHRTEEPAPAVPSQRSYGTGEGNRSVSRLNQWPCQIKLLPTQAPFFEGAKLLIAADCTAYAYANMHEDFMKGRITLIGCPKLDDVDYSEKLTAIIRDNDIKSVTIVRMEVPCCGGLQRAAENALRNSGKFIPWQVVTISRDGRILD